MANTQNTDIGSFNIKRSDLNWWHSLSESEKRDEEYKTFGYGEQFEYNALTEKDIILMYNNE